MSGDLISHLPPRICADALWLITARSRSGSHWLANADCRIDTIAIAGNPQPVSLLNKDSNVSTSYVSSPRSAWLRYARQEACDHASTRYGAIARVATSCLFSPLSTLIDQSKIDQSAIVGNHLISTNLYPDWQAQDIGQMTQELLESYPNRPLLMRNVCPTVTPQLAQSLTVHGWELAPARMIYTCDPAQTGLWKHNHVKQDQKLLADKQIEVIPPEQVLTSDLRQMRTLFRQLFIEKHSQLNPDFTTAFFELCQETGFLDLYGLRWQNRVVGVLGLYENQESGWLTTPLIGYDTTMPQAMGLYRRLMALLLQQAHQRKLKLHYSSGASQFKRLRGGIASLEYTAIYRHHLPRYQRCAIQLLTQGLQRFAPPLLTKADQF